MFADRPLTDLLAGLCSRVGYWCLHIHWYRMAAAAFAAVLRFQPDDTYALFYGGWTLNYLERHGEAIRYFDRLQTLTPSGMADYLKGLSLHAESRHPEAIVAFRSAIARGGESEVLADVYNSMGHSLAVLARHLEAKEAFEQAAFLDPASTYGWESMGTQLACLGRWKEAVPCLERAMRIEPNETVTMSLVWSLLESNRYEDAETVARDASRRDSRSARLKSLLASVLIALERNDGALEAASEACALDPSSTESHQTLAAALAACGRFPEAYRAAERAIELDPSSADTWASHGNVALEEKNGAGALRSFERALEVHRASHDALERTPGGVWVHCAFGRACALSLLERHADAIQAFGAVLDADPTLLERWKENAKFYQASRDALARGSGDSSQSGDSQERRP